MNQLHLRLPPELYSWLKTRAENERRSLNTYVLLVLENWKRSKEKV